MKSDENKLKAEYDEFMSLTPDHVPYDAAIKIKSEIYQALHPSPYKVFLIILTVQSIMGMLSLSLCHQFDMNPFNTSFSFSEYFMRYGHTFCMFCCGTLFLGVGPLVAGFFLSKDQMRVLRKNVLIFIPTIGLSTLLLFYLLGANMSLHIALTWLLGAFLGGTAAVELQYQWGIERFV